MEDPGIPITERLASYLCARSRWLDAAAERQPRRPRYRAWAKALRRLAHEVEHRSPDGPLMATFAHIQAPLPVFFLSENGSRLVTRYGFSPSPRGHGADEFVAELIETEIRAAVEELEDDLAEELDRRRTGSEGGTSWAINP